MDDPTTAFGCVDPLSRILFRFAITMPDPLYRKALAERGRSRPPEAVFPGIA
ncbi:MAG TPA: hypothetical protein VKR61_04435 [Bryobacteraceae bacterium]|nr:hypothetical protein [Bryobacteraceae bacterium]